jgi:cardiolipin synthase (CMP-forming)
MRRFSFALFSKLPADQFRITFSTILTIARIVLVPWIVIAMVKGYWQTAFILFLTAAISDLLDGLLARMLNQKTFLGACLDPLADKFLLISCFATLACTGVLPFDVPYWFVLLVLFRELLVVVGFIALYYTNQGMDVRPTRLGKATAALQMLFIGWLLLCYLYGWAPAKTYYVALYSITILIIVSFVQYARIGLDCFKNGKVCL